MQTKSFIGDMGVQTETVMQSDIESGREPGHSLVDSSSDEEISYVVISCDSYEADSDGSSFHDAIESDDECDEDMDESDDEDDQNVMLTPGERAARIKQKAIMDQEGYFECNPNDVELSPVEVRERRYRLKRGLTADSGAGDPVIPRRMVNAKKIRPSAGSRRGLHYVSATDHRIPNVGEIKLDFKTDEGIDDSIVFQVADVNKPLMSISERVDHRCRVVFDQDDDTGEDLSHIFNKKLKKKMKLKRVGKVWVLDCTVTRQFV